MEVEKLANTLSPPRSHIQVVMHMSVEQGHAQKSRIEGDNKDIISVATHVSI